MRNLKSDDEFTPPPTTPPPPTATINSDNESCLSSPVVKTRLQSLKKGANEETYNGVVDCAR